MPPVLTKSHVIHHEGAQGTFESLDYIASGQQRIAFMDKHPNSPYIPLLTVVVLKPRVQQMISGHIQISMEDIPFIRSIVERTMEGIMLSQRKNLPALDAQVVSESVAEKQPEEVTPAP